MVKISNIRIIKLFILKRLGDNSTNYTPLNPNLNNNADIGMINSLDQYLNEINDLSGDTEITGKIFDSGEIFGITFHNDDDYGFFNFVFNIFEDIYNLLYNFDNVELDLGMFGTINSVNVKMPSNLPLYLIISSLTNSVVLLSVVFFYFRFIKRVITFDLSVIEDYDIDAIINLF